MPRKLTTKDTKDTKETVRGFLVNSLTSVSMASFVVKRSA